MKRTVSILGIGIFLTSLFSVAFADRASDYSYDNQWNSGQISTLGGIGTLSDNFVDRFMINPATPIEDSRKVVIQWLGLNINFTKDSRDTFKDIVDTVQKQEKANTTQTQQFINVVDGIQSIFGKRLGGGANLSLLAAKIYGVTLVPYFSAVVNANPRVDIWPRIDAIADAVGGLAVGYSHQISSNWTAGISVKPGYRYYASADLDASSIGGDLSGSSDTALDKLATYGGGVVAPIDLGAIYKTNIPTLDISTSIQNIYGKAFATQDTTPPDYPVRWRLGVDYTPYEGHGHRVVVATELQDIIRLFEDKSSLWFRWQWAAKYRYQFWGDKLAVGANTGFQSGYGAFGLFADLWLIKLNAGLYTREAGTFPNQKSERRFIFAASTETGF